MAGEGDGALRDLRQFLSEYDEVFSTEPVPDWPVSMVIFISVYNFGFVAIFTASLAFEYYEPHLSATALHLLGVSLALAVLWPLWLLPLLVVSLGAFLWRLAA